MKPACLRYEVGDEVKMSKKGIKHFKYSPNMKKSGVVFGYCYAPQLVRIKLYGLKNPQTFHCSFWSKV